MPSRGRGAVTNSLRSRAQDLAVLCLRIGLGVFFVRPGWEKFSSVPGIIGLWHRLHLPLPSVFGPVDALVEVGGSISMLVGLFTRVFGVLLVF
jgi:uncharacterized membrane protein YphA (DoxX/SURF4 family)